MIRSGQPGRILFALAIAAFAMLYLLHVAKATFPAIGPPWPPPAGQALAIVFGVILLGLALGLASTAWAPRAAAALAVMTFIIACILDGPSLVASVRNPAHWTSGFELVAMCGGALVLAGALTAAPLLSTDRRALADRPAGGLAIAGRLLFALSLVVFGAQHFLYGRFVATLVPEWMPGRVFWAYFVGAAFCAAALSIATGVLARLAATLLGVMFLLWVLVLHLPRSLGAPRDGNEWTSLFVALAMCGCAWVIAAAQPDRGRRLAG